MACFAEINALSGVQQQLQTQISACSLTCSRFSFRSLFLLSSTGSKQSQGRIAWPQTAISQAIDGETVVGEKRY
jgi:hypothetical protein